MECNQPFGPQHELIQPLPITCCSLSLSIVSHMQIWSWHPSRNTKYRNLQQKIWMTPFIDNRVAPALQTFLLAFSSKSPNITYLKIFGTLNPAKLYFSPQDSQFPSIHTLYVMSFQILENKDIIQRFLQAFPNLVDLSVAFRGWELAILNIMGDLFWPHLKKLRLDDL
jgi:hypothetical protein